MLDNKAINKMFMTLKVKGAMPLHMLDLQKQASLSLTMSDFLSLNMRDRDDVIISYNMHYPYL